MLSSRMISGAILSSQPSLRVTNSAVSLHWEGLNVSAPK